MCFINIPPMKCSSIKSKIFKNEFLLRQNVSKKCCRQKGYNRKVHQQNWQTDRFKLSRSEWQYYKIISKIINLRINPALIPLKDDK